MLRREFLFAGGVACLLSALTVPASAQDGLAKIKASGKIRVALEFGRPPWGYKNEALQPAGSDYETAVMLAKDLGVTLEIVEVTGPNRVPFLISNRADVVISTFSITPERQKVIDFSVPYASAIQYVAASKSVKLESQADLAGKRVGVTRGTTGDAVLSKLAVPGIEIVRFDDESTNMTAFSSGQVDIVVQEPAVINRVSLQNPDKEIERKFVIAEFDVGIGLRKKDDGLKAYLDHWVRLNLKNGQLNRIYEEFHGAPISQRIISGSD
jgi:polar amino acid transport system substrate-binding protein